MAQNPAWSGALHITALVRGQVSIYKGTEDYKGKEALRELCECHHQPFTRKTVCVKGRRRLTKDMEKAGDIVNTTNMVKGVANGVGEDGEEAFKVLPDKALAEIAEAGISDTIAIVAVLNPDEVPLERTSGMYYLGPDKKVKGSDGLVDVVHGALAKSGKVAIAKWAPRGREYLITIRARDEKLVVGLLVYESEMKQPEAHLLLGSSGVSDAEIDLSVKLLEQLPGEFDFAAACDEAVPVRQRAIEAAREGKPVPTREPQAEPEAVPNLMAALQAALDAGPAEQPSGAARKNGKALAGSAT